MLKKYFLGEWIHDTEADLIPWLGCCIEFIWNLQATGNYADWNTEQKVVEQDTRPALPYDSLGNQANNNFILGNCERW